MPLTLVTHNERFEPPRSITAVLVIHGRGRNQTQLLWQHVRTSHVERHILCRGELSASIAPKGIGERHPPSQTSLTTPLSNTTDRGFGEREREQVSWLCSCLPHMGCGGGCELVETREEGRGRRVSQQQQLIVPCILRDATHLLSPCLLCLCALLCLAAARNTVWCINLSLYNAVDTTNNHFNNNCCRHYSYSSYSCCCCGCSSNTLTSWSSLFTAALLCAFPRCASANVSTASLMTKPSCTPCQSIHSGASYSQKCASSSNFSPWRRHFEMRSTSSTRDHFPQRRHWTLWSRPPCAPPVPH